MEFERQFVPQCVHTALEIDGPEAFPLSSQLQDISAPSEVLSQFNDISFLKGKRYIYSRTFF